jgi:hypothetical protein
VWQPQADVDTRQARAPALWTSTEDPLGGRPLAYAEDLARLQQVLADRAEEDPVSWPVPQVGVVRGQHALLLVHTEAGSAKVTLQGRPLTLGPYEVRYVTLPTGPATVQVPGDPGRWMPAAAECFA